MMWKDLMNEKEYKEYRECVNKNKWFYYFAIVFGVVLIIFSARFTLDVLISGVAIYFLGYIGYLVNGVSAQNKMIYKKLVRK